MSSDSHILSVQVNPYEAKARGREDFNFFAGLCLGAIMRFPFPRYYIALWLILIKAIDEKDSVLARKVLRYAVGLPRGFAKTTFLKVLVCWLICYDKLQFILIICATEPLAEAFLADVNSILQSETMEAIFGIWRPAIDNADTKKGVYNFKIIILKARGSGSAIRGINEDHIRPQMILCDDMQTKENDSSEAEREALLNWFVGTLLKTTDPFISIVFYVGNMYSDHCLLYLFKKNPNWISLITGAILEDGTSLWPELWTIEALYADFCHDESLGKADIWFAEVMNDPIEGIASLLKGPLPVRVVSFIPRPDASFVTVDPAGFRKDSDDNVIVAHYLHDNKCAIAEMDGGIWNPQQTVENTIDMAVRHESSLVAVEEVAYQQSLLFWIEQFLEAEQITGISVVPLKRGVSKSKEQHIRLFISELYAESSYFIRPQDRAKFTWQATAYRVGKQKNKDDWLDAPAMGVTVRNMYSHMLTVRQREQRKVGVVGNNTPFDRR